MSNLFKNRKAYTIAGCLCLCLEMEHDHNSFRLRMKPRYDRRNFEEWRMTDNLRSRQIRRNAECDHSRVSEGEEPNLRKTLRQPQTLPVYSIASQPSEPLPRMSQMSPISGRRFRILHPIKESLDTFWKWTRGRQERPRQTPRCSRRKKPAFTTLPEG